MEGKGQNEKGKKQKFGVQSFRLKTWNLIQLILLFVFCASAFAQVEKSKNEQPVLPQPRTQPAKANATTATETSPEVKPEPFEKAGVEIMAKQCVTIETEIGNIEIEVFPKEAPETVRNFLNLVSIGAYDTMTFNRIVKDFVIQTGNAKTREDLTAELYKRIRQTIPDEPNSIKHVRGIVSIARLDEPNKATSQFFILVSTAENLDGKFAAFGRVTKGMEIVEAINKAETTEETPVKPIRIKRAVVTECKKIN